MKLKNINEKYLNSKIKELASIRKDIAELESIINSEDKIKSIIIAQLEEVQKKYVTPRKTEIITEHKTISKEDLIESYPVKVCITKEGYLKKIKASGYRESNNFTLKENDKLNIVLEADNKGYILLFTDKYNVYKKRINDFPDVKMSQLGTFLPNLIELEKEEKVTNAVYTMNFEENLLISFKHGNVAKIPLQSYCKSRNKLTGAYSNEDEVVNMFTCNDTDRIILKSSIDKILILDIKDLPSKKSKATIGVSGMKSKDNSYVSICLPLQNVDGISNADYYKGSRNSVGKFLRKKLDEFIVK